MQVQTTNGNNSYKPQKAKWGCHFSAVKLPPDALVRATNGSNTDSYVCFFEDFLQLGWFSSSQRGTWTNDTQSMKPAADELTKQWWTSSFKRHFTSHLLTLTTTNSSDFWPRAQPYRQRNSLLVNVQGATVTVLCLQQIPQIRSPHAMVCQWACVITNTLKFSCGLTHAWCHDLHWLDVSDCVTSAVRPHVKVSTYPGTTIVCHHLRSARHGHLDVPQFRLTTHGECSFICTAAAAWNSMPDSLEDTALSTTLFSESPRDIFLFNRYANTEPVTSRQANKSTRQVTYILN